MTCRQSGDLEDQLLLYGSDQPRVDHEIARASREVFGIEDADTQFEFPEEYWDYPEDSPEATQIDDLEEEYEQQFETTDLTDDEAMEHLDKLGLDFSDGRGQPLRCTKRLSRVAEAAAKGIKGKMPDPADRWGDALARDREAFLAKKRRA